MIERVAGLLLGGVILFAAYKVGGWEAVLAVGILGFLFRNG